MRQLRNGVPSDRKVTIRLDRIEADVYWTLRWAVGATTWSDLLRGALERLRMEAEGHPMPLPTRPLLYDLADGNSFGLTLSPAAQEAMADVIDVVEEPAKESAEQVPDKFANKRRGRTAKEQLSDARKKGKARVKLTTFPTPAPKAPANGRTKGPKRKAVKNAR